MGGRRIAKTAIATLAVCALALAVATTAGAQDRVAYDAEEARRVLDEARKLSNRALDDAEKLEQRGQPDEAERPAASTGSQRLRWQSGDWANAQPEEAARGAGSRVVYTDSNGVDYYLDSDGNEINCNGYDPNGNWVSCPSEETKPGFIDKAKQQWNQATEKVKKTWKVIKNPGEAADEFLGDLLSSTPQPQQMENSGRAFESAYENRQPSVAAEFGRAVGRAVARKQEQKRREKAHRRLLSTLDRQERAKGPRDKSSYQATVGTTVLPGKPRNSMAPAQRRASIAKHGVNTGTVQVIRPENARKNYAVKPGHYSRGSGIIGTYSRSSGSGARSSSAVCFCYPSFEPDKRNDPYYCCRGN